MFIPAKYLLPLLVLAFLNLSSTAQERTIISVETVDDIRILGARKMDVCFAGHSAKPDQVILETQEARKEFDVNSSRFVGWFHRSAHIYDDTTLQTADEPSLTSGILATTADGQGRLWNTRLGINRRFLLEKSNKQIERSVESIAGVITGGALSTNSQHIAINLLEFDPEDTGCQIGYSVVKLYDSQGLFIRQHKNAGGGGRLEFCSDGSQLAFSNHSSNSTQIVDVDSGEVLYSLPGTLCLKGKSFHPNKKQIALMVQNQCTIWNTESGKLVQTLEVDAPPKETGAVWTPNGEILVVAANGLLTLYDVKNWSQLRELDLHNENIGELLITRDGCRIIAASKTTNSSNTNEQMVESWGIN